MERAEAEAIYDAGRETVVEVLLAMDRRIRQLETRVEKLERELAKNSRNSSLPPSSDPPGKRRPPRGARIARDFRRAPSRATRATAESCCRSQRSMR
ncbi:MAG: DUF6444 domain-containing protein [Solirubrobacteraceae bacterium]